MLESFLTTEFLSLVGGSIAGFIFKSLAEKRQDEKERFERDNPTHRQAERSR